MALQDRLRRLREIEGEINRNLFIICSIVTFLVMAMIVFSFFSRGAFPPTKIHLFYLGVLILYSFHKELVRWLGKIKIERQGEYFVYGWVGLTTLLYIINFLSKDYFSYSPQGEPLTTLGELTILTLEILAIFIFTRILKILKVFVIK